MAEFEITSPMATSTASGEVSASSGNNQIAEPEPVPPSKKKRNLPGMPDPDALVIALSPKTLMATNRFVCEICNKGFQRDQNLQLHRRGHNLPWKLKQRASNELVRKKVYVCPEPSCVHHDPSRALGDLTGIKKHYCRKHGEKKWKCERCSKKYAVQADWKAHMKTCGSREYKCDCGTLFSRRDSFITHRAFCDALAEESARAQKPVIKAADNNSSLKLAASSPPPPPPHTPSATAISPVLSIHSPELPESSTAVLRQTSAACSTTTATATSSHAAPIASSSNVGSTSSTSVFASIFAPSTVSPISHPSHNNTSATLFPHLISSSISPSNPPLALPSTSTTEPISLRLSLPSLYLSSDCFSLFPAPDQQDHHRHFAPSLQPAMSATALLQKAAQMGATASNGSLLRGLGLSTSSSVHGEQDNTTTQWSSHVKPENISVTAGLGLGLPSGGTAGLTDLMMGPSSLYGSKPATLDLLGLGIGSGNTTTGGLSALLNSFGEGLDVAASVRGGNSREQTWEIQTERKPKGPSLL